MASLNAYLVFNGNCREAMSFYKSCLGGELILNTVGNSPLAAQMPAGRHDKILHSVLASGKMVLMGSDMVAEEGSKPGNTISLCLICDSRDEIKNLFSKLSERGRVRHPLKEEFFGTFGDLTDRFGVNWMLMFGGKPKA